MKRKRITELFPLLLPLRQKQRKICFYLKMKIDKNKYSNEVSIERLPFKLYKTHSKMINYNSGYDIKYQHNKIHNLKIASSPINGLIIKPGETFSFWNLVKNADKHEAYKDGLLLVNGEIIGSYGGGLCQLSNLLFEIFLHSPLDIVERYGHAVKTFPTSEGIVTGVDATISEGWKDLKVKNNTKNEYQIKIYFDDEYIFGELLCNEESMYEYEIFNNKILYFKRNNKIYEKASVDCKKINTITGQIEKTNIYDNECEVGYKLPKEIEIEV